MTQFLQTVAQHYFFPMLSKQDGNVDYLKMADYMFVFPSRRAGLFFFQCLNELNGKKPMLAPETVTMGDLFDLFANSRVADRTELLFRLFKIYNEVKREKAASAAANGKTGASAKEESFEEFVFWGEMLLRDFDDVDKYLVNAEEVFLNVRDMKEIDERFKGFDPAFVEALRTFWKNVKPWDTNLQPAKEQFVQTWEILYEVYARFKAALRKEGLAYEGMRQRWVIDQLRLGALNDELKKLPEKVVLVGITAMNAAERELLLALKELGKAEFCWDYADARALELPFVRANLKDFPNALSKEEECAGVVPDAEKRLVRMAVPSAVGQTAEAAKCLQRWSASSDWDGQQALQTAVVLPDERLLNAMLYAIPENFGTYNVTMGYSLRSTSASALVDALVFLQNNYAADRVGKGSFYYKAVLPVLAHAYLLHLEPDACAELNDLITRKGLYQVPVDLFEKCELLRLIFRPVQKLEETVSYLQEVFLKFYEAFKNTTSVEEAQEAAMLDMMEPSLPGMEPTPSELDNGMALDRECLSTYLKLVKSLQKVVASADMHDLHRNMFLHLLQKLANGETVSFSGEPLSGLQIMGVLETRALDFERLVLPSMNEGVVPAKPQQNTFIPNALRTAFGLPTQTYRDDVFAYHFFRLISRAKEVVFMYDCRTSGMQSGEQSRYLLQLQYLSDAKLEDVSPDMPIATEDVMPIEVQKSPRVMAKLKEFQPGGRRFISASNLKTYMACPLQFYLAYVEGLSTNDELEDEMDDSRFGNILHATLQQFYNRLRGQWVLDDVLKKALHDDSSLRSMIMDQYGQQDGLRAGYQQLICEMILSNVRSVLTFDRSLTPFQYLAAESQCRLSYRVNDGLSVNMKAVYDRLDRVKDRDGNECLRVVDYKTGNPLNRKASKLQVNGIDLAFEEGNGCSKEAFQVMFYCLMLKKLDARTLESLGLSASDMNTLRVQPHLYFTRELVQDKEKNVTVLHYKRGKEKKSDELETKAKESFEEQDMLDFSVFANDFERGLNHLLEELFDRNVPFKQAEEDHTCKYCKFRSLCGKIISNKDE